MEVSLLHVLKEEYTVCYIDNNDKRNYLTTIYSSSVSTTEDIDDALKVKTEEEAQAALLLARSVSKNFKNYPNKITHVATIVEDIDNK